MKALFRGQSRLRPDAIAQPALATAQRCDAGCPVYFLPIAGAARFDIGRLRLASRCRRIEIDVEHARLAGKLQLAGVTFPDIEPGRVSGAGSGR